MINEVPTHFAISKADTVGIGIALFSRDLVIGETTCADNSNHYRGQAADIDMINGQPVNMYNKDPQVKAWVDSIVNRFNARHDHEVFGPGNQLYRDRNAFEDAELAKAHKGHIHWARRR